MNHASAKRIANFINDTTSGSIQFHFKELMFKDELKHLDSSDPIQSYPVIELLYNGLSIEAKLHYANISNDLAFRPIFGSAKHTIPMLDVSESPVENFSIFTKSVLAQGYNFHFNSVAALKIIDVVIGLQEICKSLDGTKLVQEEIAQYNQIEFATKLYKLFALYNPEIYCLSEHKDAHFAEKNLSIVPSLINGAWLIYITSNKDIFSDLIDHQALWDGFNESNAPIYFNAQVTRYSMSDIQDILKIADWQVSPDTIEILQNFKTMPLSGDIQVRTTLDDIKEQSKQN